MKKNAYSPSRRKFLGNAAAAAITPPFILRSLGSFGPGAQPGKRLRHASIGVGGMGAHDLQNFKSHPQVDIVAICDVDAGHLKSAAAVVPGARTYRDWRELLEKEKDNIDSVNVTVPDHNHFIIASHAIAAGKHVYCQKPLCHDVAEVRALTRAAVRAGVVTQLGTQVAATVGDRTGVQWLREGIVGKIKHAYLCSNRPGAVEAYRLVGPRPAKGETPPAELNWEIWTGTAPMRPYAPGIYHPTKWRAWQDFGTGWSGDIGCHIFDPVWKGLELKTPLSVTAEVQQSWRDSPARRGDTWPQSNHITWKFPPSERTDPGGLTVEWFDGEFYPPEEIRALYSVEKYPAESSILIGSEGALLIPHQGTPVLLPESKFKDHKRPDMQDQNHYHNFVNACLGGPGTESFFARSGPMTETVLLGTVAIRVPDTLLEWDAEHLKFPNHPEAEKYLRRSYRHGWDDIKV
ncbi:Gfo/Idh/MocA family oxidoreductase [Compostibacter hankyongensis]|uniref:Gfo/Idh/MocA family oxidoreductase n=1 Tax=Compostibacter hankyongensis TaxID=1007089 RepID=A0ABP8FFU7_9BACT